MSMHDCYARLRAALGKGTSKVRMGALLCNEGLMAWHWQFWFSCHSVLILQQQICWSDGCKSNDRIKYSPLRARQRCCGRVYVQTRAWSAKSQDDGPQTIALGSQQQCAHKWRLADAVHWVFGVSGAGQTLVQWNQGCLFLQANLTCRYSL